MPVQNTELNNSKKLKACEGVSNDTTKFDGCIREKVNEKFFKSAYSWHSKGCLLVAEGTCCNKCSASAKNIAQFNERNKEHTSAQTSCDYLNMEKMKQDVHTLMLNIGNLNDSVRIILTKKSYA